MKKREYQVYITTRYMIRIKENNTYIIQMQGNISYLIRIEEYYSYMIRIGMNISSIVRRKENICYRKRITNKGNPHPSCRVLVNAYE